MIKWDKTYITRDGMMLDLATRRGLEDLAVEIVMRAGWTMQLDCGDWRIDIPSAPPSIVPAHPHRATGSREAWWWVIFMNGVPNPLGSDSLNMAFSLIRKGTRLTIWYEPGDNVVTTEICWWEGQRRESVGANATFPALAIYLAWLKYTDAIYEKEQAASGK